MKTTMNGWGREFGWCSVALSALTLWGCGGGDSDGEQKERPKSYEAAIEAIEEPTGTVDATTAKAIGPEFEKISTSSVSVGGTRDHLPTHAAQTSDFTFNCNDGGSISSKASGDQNNLVASVEYKNCCMSGCCMNGVGDTYYANANSSLEAFTYCASYDLTTSCTNSGSSSVVFSGCFSLDGWVYAVDIDGQTFAVTGYYSNGSGKLTVNGANGTWTCEYTNHSGTCSGPDGEISF